jgi:hypothetical protein
VRGGGWLTVFLTRGGIIDLGPCVSTVGGRVLPINLTKRVRNNRISLINNFHMKLG